jgi:hypothetical protein
MPPESRPSRASLTSREQPELGESWESPQTEVFQTRVFQTRVFQTQVFQTQVFQARVFQTQSVRRP